jgi:hypothetical protein
MLKVVNSMLGEKKIVGARKTTKAQFGWTFL